MAGPPSFPVWSIFTTGGIRERINLHVQLSFIEHDSSCGQFNMVMFSDENRKSFPLALAGEGEHVRITQLKGANRQEKRLASMGLNVSSELLISQRQGGNLVVVRGETRLAVGAGLAHKIMVTQI